MAAASSPDISMIQQCGAGDSFLLKAFYSPMQAANILAQIDARIKYLERKDPHVQFKIYGRTHGLARDKAILGKVTEKDGVREEPFYKYAAATPPVEAWQGTILEKVAGDLQSNAGAHNQTCNHVVVNQYRTGQDYIGFHADKSKTFYPGSSVLTVSLGADRTLRLKCVKGAKKGEVHDILLSNGSLFVLGPNTNAEWKHSILKTMKAVDRRVSLTYRCIAAVRTTVVHSNVQPHAQMQQQAQIQSQAQSAAPSSAGAASGPSVSSGDGDVEGTDSSGDDEDSAGPASSSDDDDEADIDDHAAPIFEIKRILDRRGSGNNTQYYIEWEGYVQFAGAL